MGAHQDRGELHRWIDAMLEAEAAGLRAYPGYDTPRRRLSREESMLSRTRSGARPPRRLMRRSWSFSASAVSNAAACDGPALSAVGWRT